MAHAEAPIAPQPTGVAPHMVQRNTETLADNLFFPMHFFPMQSTYATRPCTVPQLVIHHRDKSGVQLGYNPSVVPVGRLTERVTVTNASIDAHCKLKVLPHCTLSWD